MPRPTDRLPEGLRNKLGIAVAQRAYKTYVDLLASDRWQQLAKAGASPQRMLWASTSAKDPSLPDGYYVSALAADNTVNTMPEVDLARVRQRGRGWRT